MFLFFFHFHQNGALPSSTQCSWPSHPKDPSDTGPHKFQHESSQEVDYLFSAWLAGESEKRVLTAVRDKGKIDTLHGKTVAFSLPMNPHCSCCCFLTMQRMGHRWDPQFTGGSRRCCSRGDVRWGRPRVRPDGA